MESLLAKIIAIFFGSVITLLLSSIAHGLLNMGKKHDTLNLKVELIGKDIDYMKKTVEKIDRHHSQAQADQIYRKDKEIERLNEQLRQAS